jgi:hypothetical protein
MGTFYHLLYYLQMSRKNGTMGTFFHLPNYLQMLRKNGTIWNHFFIVGDQKKMPLLGPFLPNYLQCIL